MKGSNVSSASIGIARDNKICSQPITVDCSLAVYHIPQRTWADLIIIKWEREENLQPTLTDSANNFETNLVIQDRQGKSGCDKEVK